MEEPLGECREGDVEERLDELEALSESYPDTAAADRTALRTLGNETGYRLVRLLDTADRDLCVCEITPLVDVSESAVSHALADLTEASLTTRRKDGTWHYYDTTARAEQVLSALDATRGDAA